MLGEEGLSHYGCQGEGRGQDHSSKTQDNKSHQAAAVVEKEEERKGEE